MGRGSVGINNDYMSSIDAAREGEHIKEGKGVAVGECGRKLRNCDCSR